MLIVNEFLLTHSLPYSICQFVFGVSKVYPYKDSCNEKKENMLHLFGISTILARDDMLFCHLKYLCFATFLGHKSGIFNWQLATTLNATSHY